MKITPQLAANILANQHENMTGRPAPKGLDCVTTFDELQAAMPEFSSLHSDEIPRPNKNRSMLVRPQINSN